MTPDQISALVALVSIFRHVSAWPLGMILCFVVAGPWVLSLLLAGASRKRFEEMARMYESNVKLVKAYEDLAKDLKDVVILNTQTFSELTSAIRDNQFCPMVRREGGTG